MSTGLLVGLTLTGVAVVAFLVWTRHEVGRIDEVIDEVDERLDDGDGGADGADGAHRPDGDAQ